MGIAATTGIISGLNTDEIISALLSLRQRPIAQLQSRISGFQDQLSAHVQINIALLTLRTAVENLSGSTSFRARSASVSNSDALSVSVDETAAKGSCAVQVLQLASAHRLSAQGFADLDTTPVASGAGVFKFKVGTQGTQTSIAVTAATTLADLRDAINAADAGVGASIINDGSATNPHRLVLTAEEERLRAQFTALETLLAQFQTTSSFLTDQLSALAALTTQRS